MTREEAIKMLKYNSNVIHKTMTGETDTSEVEALDMAIKALEIVKDFEKAQIITGGRLNGRTYAYKCGLDDGKRKALEQEGYYKDLAQSYEKTIVKLTEAVAERQPSEDCVSRKAVLEMIEQVQDAGGFIGYNTYSEAFDRVDNMPPVTPTRKKGKWILTDDFVYCSECEDSYYPRPIDASWYYCPMCGAEMESEE